MQPLTPVAFEVSWQCPRCKQPLLVNGVTESLHCSACQSVVQTPAAFWRDVLLDAFEYGLRRTCTTMTVMNQWGTASVTYDGGVPVCCPSPCDTPVPGPALEQALQSGADCGCEVCGKTLRVRAAPEWFRTAMHDRIVGLAGERHASDSAGSAGEVAVRFHCFGCGAVVPLDGSSRQVTCGFCQTALVVPDAIWVRLHPAPVLSRWYVLAR